MRNETIHVAAGYEGVVPEPTLSCVPYGEHDRHVLDFWQAPSAAPTPLVLAIHGGGWEEGSKERLSRFVDPDVLLRNGISIAAINYRLVAQAGGVQPPVKVPLQDAARALQFVRHQSGEWNIDKTRVGLAGGSAGACSALWLGYHDDLAERESDDPVSRESTKPRCMALFVAQTSLDPLQMKEWIPNINYGGHAFGIQDFSRFLAERDRILPWIEAYSPYALLRAGAPPTYLAYQYPPALGQDQPDATHSPNFGVKLQEKCRALGVSCELVYPGAPDVRHESATAYLVDMLTAE
jgi:acetyl esterase/lipase